MTQVPDHVRQYLPERGARRTRACPGGVIGGAWHPKLRSGTSPSRSGTPTPTPTPFRGGTPAVPGSEVRHQLTAVAGHLPGRHS
ncbi:hypothetical protein [Streptomyces beihaiensis]|uniref:Uncharacterized protein n=1 Tax=Streptomyces beihaiensis TaxID=2984495 RepID=A0ABT3U2X4_9ACTN|nr:hypothetical protein [Streptomyces beihaiensis]MCX3063046.1 hypothetical protein [Streptomyces beihaiensis]